MEKLKIWAEIVGWAVIVAAICALLLTVVSFVLAVIALVLQLAAPIVLVAGFVFLIVYVGKLVFGNKGLDRPK